MGLTIHYRFQPELPPDLPVTDPDRAKAIIAKAAARAQAALLRQGIPAATEPLINDIGQPYIEAFKQEVVLSGPGKGAEPLTLGWTRHLLKPWFNRCFIKTQYAADFIATHAAVCAILDELETAGIIGEVHDEADFYRSGRSRADLAQEYGEANALLGRIQDQLQEMEFSYEFNTLGGVLKRFPEPPSEQS